VLFECVAMRRSYGRSRGGRRRSKVVLGTLGFLASAPEPFCAACRRTRIEAEKEKMRRYLFSHVETQLRDLLERCKGHP
jgi:GTP 3',8-cyclase